MTDRELFQKAVKSLPFLGPPLLGTLLVGWLGGEVLPGAVFSMAFGNAEPGFGPVLAFLAAWGVLGWVADLLRLGAFRLCLDRGEGKEESMPWTILPQWRRYIGWVVWATVLSVFWRLGRRLLTSLAVDRLDYRQVERFFVGQAYVNVALTVFSLLVTALLFLSIRTAYLRAPERGFWRAVGFGLGEGLRKWPRTIGVQLKFVVPVHVGQGIASILLHRLAFRAGGPGISALCGGAGQVLGWMSTIWILTLYGQLAADRYDYPEKKEEVETL